MDELKFNTKRTWAEIDLNAVRDNYMAIRRSLPDGCRFLGVVKANAYGHGALEVSSLLQECGADYLAVSCLDEALDLREGGISMPILILGHTPAEYTDLLIENDITQTVTCLAKAYEYSEACAKLGKTLKVHHKITSKQLQRKSQRRNHILRKHGLNILNQEESAKIQIIIQ
jgi:alanine racemase